MKWGVRRYQNYDGSYTKAGMKRYNASLEKYEKADARYKDLKKTGASKADVTNAKLSRKQAKQRLNKDYKHLKQDKLGDKGKALYANGKTITGNNKVTSILAEVGAVSLAAAKYNNDNHMFDDRVTKALATTGVASLSLSAVKSGIDANQARKLRAYYSHTSNY